MAPSRDPNEAQREGEIRRLVALKFDKIGRMALFYLATDLDNIAEKTITTDLRYLERIHSEFARSRKALPREAQMLFRGLADKIEGQISQIIRRLYSARHHKKKDEMEGFYDAMEESRKHWRSILDLLRRELRIE